jgi:hypothetical protein
MRLFISQKNARHAALQALRGKVKSFRLEPRVVHNRDGSADCGFAVVLLNAQGLYVGTLR